LPFDYANPGLCGWLFFYTAYKPDTRQKVTIRTINGKINTDGIDCRLKKGK